MEKGWHCSSKAVPSVCWKLSEPSIVEKKIDGSLISLKFNETVILNKEWSKKSWRVEVSGPLSPYTINWEFISADILMVPTQNLTVWFSFEIEKKQLFGNGSETINIYFDDLQVMNSYSYNFQMINKSVSLDLFPREAEET